MMEHIVTSVGGIAGFGVISICLFVAVFSGALVWAFCQKKSFLAEMESLPLRDEESDKKGD
jgi:hypothetical protein